MTLISTTTASRIDWVDSMKVIGMYFIVVGHMFPNGYESIYAFSVPLFFIVSGLLSKREQNHKLFLSKIFRSLVVPMAVFSVILLLYYLIVNLHAGDITLRNFGLWFVQILIGSQNSWLCPFPGLSVCWFIYSLIVIKIIFNYVPVKIQRIFLLPTSIIAVIIWHYFGFSCGSSYTDAVLAYPFFMFGSMMKRHLKRLNDWNPLNFIGVATLILSFAAIIIIPIYNSWPMMYLSEYGNNYVLFIVGAFSGTYIVYFVSKLLGNRFSKQMSMMSTGNILTLGLHIYPVIIYNHLHISSLAVGLVIGLVIMVSMYPVIYFVLHRIPWLIGRSYSKGA